MDGQGFAESATQDGKGDRIMPQEHLRFNWELKKEMNEFDKVLLRHYEHKRAIEKAKRAGRVVIFLAALSAAAAVSVIMFWGRI